MYLEFQATSNFLCTFYATMLGGKICNVLPHCCLATGLTNLMIQQLPSVPQIPNLVMESMDVPGLGCFTAYKSGWVRICFLDRAQLDFHCPELAVHKEPSLKLDRFTELAPNMCRLMLPNGRYETFSVTSPLQFAWCVCVCV